MIYLSESAIARMDCEVKLARQIETGGILVGVLLCSGDILITHATSPGPKAIKCPNYFIKDYNYTIQILNILYYKYSVDYLGEWHKHPNNIIHYSHKDLCSMRSISSLNSNPCFFIIVGSDFNKNTPREQLKLYSIDDKGMVIETDWDITFAPEELAREKGILMK